MDTAFWITSAIVLALIAASAFFSGSETALTAASRAKLTRKPWWSRSASCIEEPRLMIGAAAGQQ